MTRTLHSNDVFVPACLLVSSPITSACPSYLPLARVVAAVLLTLRPRKNGRHQRTAAVSAAVAFAALLVVTRKCARG